MEEVFSIVLVIIGSLIGAGFASGQEIYSFFYSYGIGGICGIIITFLLIGILIYKSLKLIYTYEINDYDEFLEIFIKNKKISKVPFWGLLFFYNVFTRSEKILKK